MGAAAQYFRLAIVLLEITLVVTVLVRLEEDSNFIGGTLEYQLKARALFIEEQLGTAQDLARVVTARGAEVLQSSADSCIDAGKGQGEEGESAKSRFALELQSLLGEFRLRGIYRLQYASPCLAITYPPLADRPGADSPTARPAVTAGSAWSTKYVRPGDQVPVISWIVSDKPRKSTATVDIAAFWLWRMTLPMEGAVNEVILFGDDKRVVAQSSEPIDFESAPDLAGALAKVPAEAASFGRELPSAEAIFAGPEARLRHAGDWYTASIKVSGSPFILSVFVPFLAYWQFIVDRNLESIIGISVIGLAIFILYWFVSRRILRPAAAAQRVSIELSERLQGIFGAVHDGILLTDSDGAIVSRNRSLEALLKVPDLLLQAGSSLHDVAEHLRGRSAALADALLEVAGTANATAEARDGSGRWLYLRSAEIRETGQTVTVVTDTTVRRDLEEALAQARDQAEDAARAKSAFLATMSHEIRTPMNGIVSVAEMLEDSLYDDDQRSLIRIIRNSGDVLQSVINDILDFSKIEAGKLEIERVAFDPADVVSAVGRILAPRAEEQSTELTVTVDPAMPMALNGDPTRLKQILLNLAGNAVKFTKHGRVEIRIEGVRRDDTYVMRGEVVDTGIGMTQEQQERLFRPFQQADSSMSRKFGGSGLGLSICASLIQMMGGSIGCSSIWQRGSTFWFEVPMPISNSAPHAPLEDISSARVGLVAYGSAEAAALKRYLDHAGAQVVVDCGVDQILQEGEAALARIREADAVLLNATSSLEALKPILPTLWAEIAAGHGKLIVSGPYMARSLLKATGSGEIKIFGSISAPIGMRRVWHAIAAAMGKTSLADYESATSDLPRFTPPQVDVARKANALVLVAEDNVTNQQVIRRILSRVGYACEIASNGIEALAMLKRGGYGILLTDIHMPDMDGFELTQEIRRFEAAARGARLDVVALTADVLSQTEAQCQEAGMDGYLRKPVVVKQLAEVLERRVPQGIALRRESSEGAARAPARDGQPEAVTPKAPSSRSVRNALDLSALKETFGELDASVYEIIVDFVDSTGGRLETLESQIDARDLRAAGNTAHAMKGAAQSVGAVEVGRVTASLEAVCKDGDYASAGPLLKQLRSACSELTVAALPLRDKATV